MTVSTRRMPAALFALAALSVAPAALADTHGPAAAADAPALHVYKSPSCSCCAGWVEHMRREGFAVRVTERDDLDPVKKLLGVAPDLQSCHTATVGGYTIEGHVPAADVKRLLAARTGTADAAAGLAAPGMPVGSPGMEQGGMREPYDVILFSRDGRRVFSRH